MTADTATEVAWAPNKGVNCEKNVPYHDENHPAPKLTDFKFVMVIVSFGMAFVGSQVQPLLFAAINPIVAESLDAASVLIWFFTAPVIATGVIAPFAGPLADIFGRKRITVAGVLVSMVGMILAAATPNAGGFIVSQAFAGIGIAVGYYIAIVVASFLPFAPASLYGELISHTSWRYCACFIAIWNFLTATIIFIFYKPPPRPNEARRTWFQKLKHVDFFGGFLMTSGVVLFLVGFNWGGQQYPWSSARVIAFLTIGLALIVIFLLYEAFLAPHFLFPRRLLKHPRTFIALMLILEAVGIYESNLKELGVRTLPFGFYIVGGALISAIMVSAFKGYSRSVMTFFYVIQAIAIACMAAVDTRNIAIVWAPLVLALIAVGGVLIPNQIIMTVICPDDLIATGTSFTVCLHGIGQVIGISIFYTQFLSTLTHHTVDNVVPVAVEVGIYDSNILQNMMSTLVSVSWKEWVPTIAALNTPEKLQMLHTAVVDAFAASFARVWYITIPFGVLAVIASLFIENLTSLIDEHIAINYL